MRCTTLLSSLLLSSLAIGAPLNHLAARDEPFTGGITFYLGDSCSGTSSTHIDSMIADAPYTVHDSDGNALGLQSFSIDRALQGDEQLQFLTMPDQVNVEVFNTPYGNGQQGCHNLKQTYLNADFVRHQY